MVMFSACMAWPRESRPQNGFVLWSNLSRLAAKIRRGKAGVLNMHGLSRLHRCLRAGGSLAVRRNLSASSGSICATSVHGSLQVKTDPPDASRRLRSDRLDVCWCPADLMTEDSNVVMSEQPEVKATGHPTKRRVIPHSGAVSGV